MADLTLTHYHAPQSRSAAILWLFEELGATRETHIFNLQTGDHKAAWYLALNPMGKVPAIKHGETVVTEQSAIAIYLADLFPEAGLAPKIGDPARGTYLRWIVYNSSVMEPALIDRAMKREGGNPGMLPYGSVDQAIETLAGALAKGPYLLGERFSAADVIVGSAVSWMLMFKMLPERPEFTTYVALLETRPARLRQKALDAEFLAKFAAA